MEFRALRHNTAGQDGYEFIGPWRFAAAVKDTLLRVGEKSGLVHVGALAYASASVESGWISSPVPAIYTDPDLAGYRAWLPLFGIEGQRPLVFDRPTCARCWERTCATTSSTRGTGWRRCQSCRASTPGAGTSPDADLGFPRIRATVAPAPYDATRGRNTGAPNCARVLLWSAPIMYFARRVFAR